MGFGSNGAILRVDLSSGRTRVEAFDEPFWRQYPGGRALAVHLLLRECPANVDPLGPDNVLVLAAGLLTGAPVSTATRFTAVARSPLTGAFGESEAGGFWGPELKMAGFDAVVVTGRAPEPVYLWVHDGTAEIRDARHLWGKTPPTVQAAIKDEVGEKHAKVLQVGPAGESGVRYAVLMNELRHYNGRGGHGHGHGRQEPAGGRRPGERPLPGPGPRPGVLGRARAAPVAGGQGRPAQLEPADEGHARADRHAQRGGDPPDPELPPGRVRGRRRHRARGL